MLLGLSQGHFPMNADASSISLLQKTGILHREPCYGVLEWLLVEQDKQASIPALPNLLFSFSYGLKCLEKIEKLLI